MLILSLGNILCLGLCLGLGVGLGLGLLTGLCLGQGLGFCLGLGLEFWFGLNLVGLGTSFRFEVSSMKTITKANVETEYMVWNCNEHRS